jgi:hypothetical protein
MKLIHFPEETVVIAANQPPYHAMPAHRHLDSTSGRITICWQLTWHERLRLLRRGRIWHQILTFNQAVQPQKLLFAKPQMPMSVRQAACRAGLMKD